MTPEHRRIEALLSLGRNDEAAALVAGLPAREAPTAEYLRLRGRVLRAAGRVFDAETAFREALAMAPRDAGLLADLATTLVGQRRAQDALPFAREAVAEKPDVAAYQALLGFVAESLERNEEARRALQLARDLAPADAEPHLVLGFHALRTGDLDTAETSFRTAMGLDPRRAEAVRGLARVALARDDWETARARWVEALRIDPRQRDRHLQPMLLVGHPVLRPLRKVTRMPVAFSVGVAAVGALVLVVGTGQVPAQVVSVGLFAVASAGPIARRVLAGGLGE